MEKESLGVSREQRADTPPNAQKSWVLILLVPRPWCQGSFQVHSAWNKPGEETGRVWSGPCMSKIISVLGCE